MALDEVLLGALASGSRGPSLRFWRWQSRSLVLGSNQSVSNEVDLEAAAALGFSVARRLSGGGTMLIEPDGVATWSLVLPDSAVGGLSFVESFALLDAFAVEALRSLGIDASYRPVNDIVSPLGKISGAAQARRRGCVLHHTTMAIRLDPALVPRLIRIGRPSVSPRGVRSAEKVVSPVSELVPGLGVAEVEAALLAAFPAPLRRGPVSPAELAAAAALAVSKYATPEWTFRVP